MREVSRSQINENHVNSERFNNESIRSPPWTTQDTYTKANAAETVGIEEIFTDFKAANREQRGPKRTPLKSLEAKM